MNSSTRGAIARLLLPRGADADALPLLVARGLRAFADGYMALLLPAYLLAIGLGTLEVGIVSTATMLGSALATLAVGAWGHRFVGRRLLRGALARLVRPSGSARAADVDAVGGPRPSHLAANARACRRSARGKAWRAAPRPGKPPDHRS